MSVQHTMRLNRLLAMAGLCSRREATEYIRQGWVRVDGTVNDTPGTQVSLTSQLELHDRAMSEIRSKQTNTILLHKPLGVVSCQPERETQTPAIQLLTNNNYYRRASSKRSSSSNYTEPYRLSKLAVAGRLDVNTTGLLLFTQCGHTASKIIGPNSQIEKEYLVRIENTSNTQQQQQQEVSLLDEHDSQTQESLEQLRQGIQSEGELLTANTVEVVNDHQLRFVLQHGKKHHIRRMVESCGNNWKVRALKRVRIGGLRLSGLAPGRWRYVKSDESL